MDDRPRKSFAASLVWTWAVLVIMLPLVYFMGYFFRCQVSYLVPPLPGVPGRYAAQSGPPASGPYVMIRGYSTDGEAILFLPAATLEGWLRGNMVTTGSSGQLFSPLL